MTGKSGDSTEVRSSGGGNRVFKLQVISRGEYINTQEYHGEIPLYNHQLKTRDKIDLFYNCSEGR